MKYTYTLLMNPEGAKSTHREIMTRLEEVDKWVNSPEFSFSRGDMIRVLDNTKTKADLVIDDIDAYNDFVLTEERNAAWKPSMNISATMRDQMQYEKSESSIAKAVTPSHYQDYILDMQWIDGMSRIPSLRNPEKFQGGLELQVRKYLDRNGGKDATAQELRKSLFYMGYWIAYLENGCQPVEAKMVQELLHGFDPVKLQELLQEITPR